MPGLSVIVLTNNSERLLERCLASVEWAEEILVLDSGSSDRTEEIARRFTEGFFSIQWRGFSATRNKGIEMSQGDWILVLDSDEVLEAHAKEERSTGPRQARQGLGHVGVEGLLAPTEGRREALLVNLASCDRGRDSCVRR